MPLKDGVSSAEHEHSLLGAEVSQIVDAISLGWYESIFQSYMAQKVRNFYLATLSQCSIYTQPVKVVSSVRYHFFKRSQLTYWKDGRTICWQELRLKSPCGYFICWKRNEDNW